MTWARVAAMCVLVLGCVVSMYAPSPHASLMLQLVQALLPSVVLASGKSLLHEPPPE